MEIAKIHYDTLSYRSFITCFGRQFLYELYNGILVDRLGFFILARIENNVNGFILGCTDSTKLMSIIFKRPFSYLRLILPKVIKKPALIIKLVETLLYSWKEGVAIKPELLVIAVDSKSRACGVGSKMLCKLNDEFKKRGIFEYKVTVHKVMDKSNNFYIKNGMELIKTFHFYGVDWNIYALQLTKTST